MSPASLMLPALLACFGPLVSAQVLPPGTCPQTDIVLIPHPTDCSMYISCNNGVPTEMHCPAGLEFNEALKKCDWPQNANCEKGCSPLQNDVGGTWTPASCTAGPNDKGASCKLQCNNGYQLRGSSSIDCTDKGWNSVNGDVIPKCLTEECIGEILDNDLNKTLSGKAGILFVLDKSGSVSLSNFQTTKDFVMDVVQAYPLSADRSAGVIIFDSQAMVRIRLNVESQLDFLKAVNRIPYIPGGTTNLLAGLEMAIDEIKYYSKHKLTVVVLITGGMSQTDGKPAADAIKNAGNPIFAIGIDSFNNLVHLEELSSRGDNGIKHFFHIKTYEALENIGKYLNLPAGSGGSSESSKCIY